MSRYLPPRGRTPRSQPSLPPDLHTRLRRRQQVRKRGTILLLGLAAGALLAFVAAGCGGGGGGGGGEEATALPSASCGPIRYGGDGKPDFLIASDLPLQGANRSLTTEMADAVDFILKQHDYKAGGKTIGYQSCDDATAQAGCSDSSGHSTRAAPSSRSRLPTGRLTGHLRWSALRTRTRG